MFGLITMLLSTLGATGMGSMLKIVGGFVQSRNEAKEAQEKRELVRDMQIIINEEQDQIKKIKDLQLKCLEAAEKLIYNIQNRDDIISDREIAEKILLLLERGSVSFNPQASIYDELKYTGSTKLIKSKNFRYALSRTYDNLNSRNMSVSRIIDDYFFQAIARVNKHIIIFSKENRENDVTVYSDLIPTDFIIDKSFYYSNSFLGDLNQLKNLIERYLDMLDKLESSYNYLKIYSEEELNK